MNKRIVVIPGDGVGEEVTSAALEICCRAAWKNGVTVEYERYEAGGAALDRYGVPLPEKTLQACREADGILLGAVGGPQWDSVAPELRPEKAILGLRKELGLYANLRPVRVPPALAGYSPLKSDAVAGLDILIVRELNGGIYYGERGEKTLADGTTEAWDMERYNEKEIGRITRTACQAALARQGRVASVDKANVLASSRLWRRTVAHVAGEFPGISLSHMYVDNCAMQLVLAPGQFDVIVTSNLFGDILSDEAAVLAGSIGMLPSASLGDGPGLYEPIHGSAPDIAGQGKANPIGTVLSAAMLLRHSLGLEKAAAAIENAVDDVLAGGFRTADLYRPGLILTSTAEMGRLIAERL